MVTLRFVPVTMAVQQVIPNVWLKIIVMYYLSQFLCRRNFGRIAGQILIWVFHAITDVSGLKSAKGLTEAGRFSSCVV